MAKKLFTINEASFNAVAIGSVVGQDYTDGQNPNLFFADGDIYSQFGWMENIAPQANVQTTDLSLATNGSFDPGDVGVLILEYPQRASGRGGFETGSTALKMTSSAVTMLGPINPSASQQGESNMPLPFFGISADGTTAPFGVALAAAS